MTIIKLLSHAAILVLIAAAGVSHAQTMVKRTAFKTDTVDFGAGGTVTITGAPFGSIRIEGWDKSLIEASAEVSIEAPTEADIETLAEVNGFIFEPTFNHLRITSVGAFDKNYLKRSKKKIPKNLIGLPFRIDYTIKVPRFCDLNVTGGAGDFSVSGVDGNMRINFVSGNGKMTLTGGAIQAVFGSGTVDVTIPTRSWRGRFADIQLTSGTMNVFLPAGLNAEFDAAVLRTGTIANSFAEIKPKSRNEVFTDKLISGRAGIGGVPLKFTVGEGTLNIASVEKSEK